MSWYLVASALPPTAQDAPVVLLQHEVAQQGARGRLNVSSKTLVAEFIVHSPAVVHLEFRESGTLAPAPHILIPVRRFVNPSRPRG